MSPTRAADPYDGRGYGDLKTDTAEIVIEFIRPIRARVRELMDGPAELRRLMAVGAGKETRTARHTLAAVYDRVGFVPLAE